MTLFNSHDRLIRETTTQNIIASGDVLVSIEKDEAGDHRWFRANPTVVERRRPATAAELQMSGHPSGTMVRMVKTDSGVLHRIYPRRTRS